jgi:hypothetical protein
MTICIRKCLKTQPVNRLVGKLGEAGSRIRQARLPTRLGRYLQSRRVQECFWLASRGFLGGTQGDNSFDRGGHTSADFGFTFDQKRTNQNHEENQELWKESDSPA